MNRDILAYEFLGTALLSMSYNFFGSQGYYTMYFILALWTWELSATHFSMGTTIGDFVCEYQSWESARKHVGNALALICVQFVGSLMGVFMTFMASHIESTSITQKVIQPTVQPLCPSIDGCKSDQKLYFNIFVMEFIGSFAIVFTFLIVKMVRFDD